MPFSFHYTIQLKIKKAVRNNREKFSIYEKWKMKKRNFSQMQ